MHSCSPLDHLSSRSQHSYQLAPFCCEIQAFPQGSLQSRSQACNHTPAQLVSLRIATVVRSALCELPHVHTSTAYYYVYIYLCLSSTSRCVHTYGMFACLSTLLCNTYLFLSSPSRCAHVFLSYGMSACLSALFCIHLFVSLLSNQMWPCTECTARNAYLHHLP